ncbi:MAG: transposase [Candidatus Aminicenantia bacterium]
MKSFNPDQKLLLSAENLFDINPLKKYQILFSNLDPSPLENANQLGPGRPHISKPALLKAFISKNLKPFPTLYDLSVDLIDNPSIALKCGLETGKNPNTIKERLSSFLRITPNHFLQKIKQSLISELVSLGEISGQFLSIDSCPIIANVKENNLKTTVKDRYDKSKIPKGDQDAKLGVIITFKKNSGFQVEYFWGYRNHVVLDALSELPVGEITKPANVSEQVLFIPLFKQTQQSFNFPIKEVIADAMYDVEYILKFVINDLKATPRIARNLRWQAHSDVKLSSSGGLLCIAGFDMLYWGKFKDRGKIRLKFVCPITHSKKFARQYPLCPWNHPKFVNGKGCFAYLRGDSTIRASIDYGSESFKESYNLRTGSERIFSRLLTLCMQNPSVIGLNATANHCTIAHITVLLVALTAVKTNHKDKIRFVKKFLPHL